MNDLGFVYVVDVRSRDGALIERECTHNLVPEEGRNYFLNAGIKGGTQYSAWYAGLYSGNYTPQPTDTAATMPSLATEFVDYEDSARPAVEFGDVSSGSVDNSASVIEVTATAAATVYGGFISSASVKGSTAGVLISVVRFTSPKQLGDGETLSITVLQPLIGL